MSPFLAACKFASSLPPPPSAVASPLLARLTLSDKSVSTPTTVVDTGKSSFSSSISGGRALLCLLLLFVIQVQVQQWGEGSSSFTTQIQSVEEGSDPQGSSFAARV